MALSEQEVAQAKERREEYLARLLDHIRKFDDGQYAKGNVGTLCVTVCAACDEEGPTGELGVYAAVGSDESPSLANILATAALRLADEAPGVIERRILGGGEGS